MNNITEINRNWHEAETALIKKDWARAHQHYLAVALLDGQHIHSLIRLASVMLKMGDYNGARTYSLQASRLETTDVKAIMMLARQLMIFAEYKTLSTYLTDYGLKCISDSQSLSEMSVLLNSIGETAHAFTFIDKAIANDPKFAPAYYFRGNLHTFAGNMSQAKNDLKRCISLNPRFAQTYWALSGINKADEDQALLGAIQQNIRQAKPGLGDEIYLYYALHNEWHKRQRPDDSWRALEYACAAKRRKINYSHDETMKLFGALKAIDWQAIPDYSVQAGTQSKAPVFIVGMHRSGTTLLEQLLAGHSAISDGGESASFLTQLKRAANMPAELNSGLIAKAAQVDLSDVANWYDDSVAWRFPETRYYTEKLPSNFLLCGFILKTIPNARIIHLVRDPMSTCFSNLRTLFHFECGYSYQQNEMADYFIAYRDLMRFWHETFPGRIADIQYDSLVQQPVQSMQDLCAYLDIAYQPDMVELSKRSGSVATASTVSVREGIKTNRNQQWQPYAAHLRPLLHRLHTAGLI